MTALAGCGSASLREMWKWSVADRIGRERISAVIAMPAMHLRAWFCVLKWGVGGSKVFQFPQKPTQLHQGNLIVNKNIHIFLFYGFFIYFFFLFSCQAFFNNYFF